MESSRMIRAFHSQFAKLGIGPVPMKPDEFAKFVRDEISTYKRIVRDGNMDNPVVVDDAGVPVLGNIEYTTIDTAPALPVWASA